MFPLQPVPSVNICNIMCSLKSRLCERVERMSECAERITESCVSAVTVIPTPEAQPSVLTHISCLVWDSPPRLTRSAGLIIFVFFCCSLTGCRAFVWQISPEGSSLCLSIPRENQKKNPAATVDRTEEFIWNIYFSASLRYK